MLMAKSWIRFFIRAKFFFLAVIIFTLAANLFLTASASRFKESVGKSFFSPVIFKRIYYLPPNFIFIQDFSVYDNGAATARKLITVPSVRINFSLWRLATKRSFYVTSVSCLGPVADSNDFMRFVGKNFGQILDFFKSLPLQDIGFSIRRAALQSLRNNIENETELNLSFNLRGKSVRVLGYIRKNSDSRGSPLRYEFKGLLTPNGIYVEKMQLSGERVRSEFWGEIRNSLAELKGFIFANTTPRAGETEERNSLGKLQSALLNQGGKSEVIGLPGADLSVFDIDARIRFDYPRIGVEGLNFVVNDNPVEITGAIGFAEPFSFKMNLHSKFRSLENKVNTGLKRISLSVSAGEMDKKLSANGTLHVDFSGNTAADLPFKNIDLAFKEAGLAFDETGCKAHIDKLDLSCETNANAYKIVMDDLYAEIPGPGAVSRIIKLRSRFYGGSLEGRAQVKLNKFTPVINSVLEVKNADANKLEGILPHFSKVYGRLGSRMRFHSSPRPAIAGGMRIENGFLIDFEFFKWLADLFSLPSLKKVDFRKADADFSVDVSGARLDNIRLDSDSVKIGGYFKLGRGDLVSSKISLVFSEALLRESPKFTPLLKVLRGELDVIVFDFQLSGELDRTNFKWLQSDFKNKVQKAIPNFVERNIEKNIEEFVEGIRD